MTPSTAMPLCLLLLLHAQGCEVGPYKKLRPSLCATVSVVLSVAAQHSYTMYKLVSPLRLS